MTLVVVLASSSAGAGLAAAPTTNGADAVAGAAASQPDGEQRTPAQRCAAALAAHRDPAERERMLAEMLRMAGLFAAPGWLEGIADRTANDERVSQMLGRWIAELRAQAGLRESDAQRAVTNEEDDAASKRQSPAARTSSALSCLVAAPDPELRPLRDAAFYLLTMQSHRADARRLARFVAANQIELPQRAELERIEQDIARDLDEQRISRVTEERVPALLEALKTAQQSAEDLALSSANARDQHSFARHARRLPCRATADDAQATTSAPGAALSAGAPRIDPTRSASTEDFYPDDARRESSEGLATVRARIDGAGCAAEALVLVASGDPRLDAAALRWTFDGAIFTPAAAHDGKPRDAWATFKVRFRLTDGRAARTASLTDASVGAPRAQAMGESGAAMLQDGAAERLPPAP